MAIKYADISVLSTGGTGVESSPYGWDEFNLAISSAGPGDVFRLRGYRANRGVSWSATAPAQISLAAWNAAAFGPWGVQTTGDISLMKIGVNGAVLLCRDLWSDSDIYTAQVLCSRRVALTAGTRYWRGVTLQADRVDWIPCGATITLDLRDCVIRTVNPGSVESGTTATTKARHSLFAVDNAKGAWYNSGSPGYAQAVWDVDATCGFGQAIPLSDVGTLVMRSPLLLPWPVRESGVSASVSFMGYETGLWGEPRAGIGGYVFGHPRHFQALKQLLPDMR